MTGDDDANRVGSIGKSYCPDGQGLSQAHRKFGVADRLSCFDRAQSLPDTLLKRGAFRGDREGIDRVYLSIKVCGHGRAEAEWVACRCQRDRLCPIMAGEQT